MSEQPSKEVAAPQQPPIVVKKYANRRLYNTSSSSYVTLEELANLLRTGREFVVFDAKSNEDITRSVLTQIILEEDSKGRNLLPVPFLRQLIGFYDGNMHALLPRYLEMTMEHFIQNQEQMQRYFEGTMGRLFPINPFNDMARQNMALMQQATSMLTPFAPNKEGGDATAADAKGEPADMQQREILALRREVEELRVRLAMAAADAPTRKASGSDR